MGDHDVNDDLSLRTVHGGSKYAIVIAIIH